MNQIKSIQRLSERELEYGILKPENSWHHEYKNQAYINFGGLDYELTEGDILTIFSQYGCPVDVKLVRDRNTGESKGFGYLKYEDQRSTVLAVDNLNGARVCDRVIRVDHVFYSPRDDEREYAEAVRKELEQDFADEIAQTGPDPEPYEILADQRLKKELKEEKIVSNADEFADPMANFIKKE